MSGQDKDSSIQGLDSGLVAMLTAGMAKPTASVQVEQQQSGGHPPFNFFSSAAFGPSFNGELALESSDDLITPGTLEAPAASGLRFAPTTAAVPLPHQCLFCGGLGTTSTCGALNPAIIDGEPGAVHHLCAIWAPGCYLPEVSAGCRNQAANCV